MDHKNYKPSLMRAGPSEQLGLTLTSAEAQTSRDDMDKDNEDTPQKQQTEEIGLTGDEHMKQTGQRRKRKPGETILQVAAGKKRGNHKPRWNVYPNVHFNVTQGEQNSRKKFPSNRIMTTKYNPFNFLPKLLFEQFRKVTNVRGREVSWTLNQMQIFFLAVVIVTFVPAVSPVSPYTSFIPLAFIIAVSALREAYEDVNRYKADYKGNFRNYQVLQSGGMKKSVPSKDLQVGDILYLEKNNVLPADVLLLKTSLPHSLCYVETAQLDGESNLKQQRAIKETDAMNEEDLSQLRGTIECEEPHPLFYTFHARLKLGEKSFALDSKQLLLRGVTIRNTAWTYGVIVYGGSDSKLSLNQRNPPSKFSSMDRQMNKIVGGIFAFMFACCATLAVLAGIFRADGDRWYLRDQYGPAVTGITTFFTYIYLLSYLIPQSLFVTLEITKVFQARFMEWDKEMRTDPDDPETGMLAKTSNLNDELALVKYIFSDKTGTLTQNKMIFDRCSVGGVVYTNMMRGSLKNTMRDPNTSAEQFDYVSDFVRALSLCHAVIAEEDEKGEINYQAQSPDESALVQGAQFSGFIFKGASSGSMTTNELGLDRQYEVLANMEFTSERARSSVIIRGEDKSIVLYSKGSDAQMLKRIGERKTKLQSEVYTSSIRHLDEFSNLGLRTLIVARRILSEEVYQRWNAKYHEANTSLNHRHEAVDKVCELIETDLEIIGCTAIEDKLQEGVPDTIEYLLQCGMKVWVITGDKQQTAINIGYATKLLVKEQPQVIINIDKNAAKPGESIQKMVRQAVETHSASGIPIAVIIDGETIHHALKECRDDFVQLTNLASAAICCRVTPLQKAEVVKTIKEAKKQVCLSIGDGANDVSMIQEADIGIGIFGKEGTQAARASDYAIQQFSHLKRLLSVHGRYSYLRNLACIHQNFYKNIAFGFIQFYFAFWSGYSGQSLFDDWLLSGYNIIFTSLPPLLSAIFIKDVKEEIIYQNPKLYEDLKTGNYFNWKTVGLWTISALYHSWVIYMVTWLLFRNEPVMSGGRTGDVYLMGQLVTALVILVVLLKISLSIVYWNTILMGSIYLSYFLFVIGDIIINLFPSWPITYWEAFTIVQVPSFWFGMLLGTAMCLLPDWSFACIRKNYFPDNWMILRERQQLLDLGQLGPDLETF
ncbi:putative phospholipid-transporting ATPase IA isoform b [Planoprotostelium fungivorum]|uniref:Phospholipid-transporting ATPase n=1 Tax=Planoprotostelium fungivorum TaxID=1890364 RepID=A0A2P6NLY3_9EUKA|nr:putative phospholipid-transporting ATPase IA isoform b [Planoprotostelium fungivorum]